MVPLVCQSFLSINQNNPNTRLDLESYKESPEVEKTADVQPLNVIEEEEESVADDYELRRMEKGRRTSTIHPRDQDNPDDDAHPKGENSAKRQKTSEHETYVFGESSSVQVNKSESCLSTSGNQEQLDDFDFWTDSYSIVEDELPTEKVSQ
uniref:Uncharacterized protein n=1 Tax=Tanacetum cinerariifolium TaxID=118510 RepID=A0A6L2MAB9_TANCI|nr:hypothetical protein [Tanacetum cinerariifolium]